MRSTGRSCSLHVNYPGRRLAYIVFNELAATEVVICVPALKDHAEHDYRTVESHDDHFVDVVETINGIEDLRPIPASRQFPLRRGPLLSGQ